MQGSFDIYAPGFTPSARKITFCPDKVRAVLTGWLDAAKQCHHGTPWPNEHSGAKPQLVKQMASWLPSQEADAMRAAFAIKATRLRLPQA